VTLSRQKHSKGTVIKTAEQRTIIQQYSDYCTCRWWVGCYIFW